MALPPIHNFHHEEDEETHQEVFTDLTDEDFPESIEEETPKEEYFPQEASSSLPTEDTASIKSDYDIQAEQILKKENEIKRRKGGKKKYSQVFVIIIVVLLMIVMVGIVFYIAKKQKGITPKEGKEMVSNVENNKKGADKEVDDIPGEESKGKESPTKRKSKKTKTERNDIIDKRIKVTQLDNSFLIETSERVDGILYLVYTKNDKSIVCRIPNDTYTKGSEKEKELECEGDIDTIREYKLSAIYVVED